MVSVDLRRGGERVVVGQRLGGGAGADHADPAVAGGGDRTPGGGEDHLDDGYVVPLAGVAEHRGAGGVAGDDQRLDALVDQVVEALEGVLADLADRLGAVGLAGGVAEVDDRLVGQLVDHRPGHGEPAEPRVEDADRAHRTVVRGTNAQARWSRTPALRRDRRHAGAGRGALRRRLETCEVPTTYSKSLACGGPKEGSTPSKRLLTDSPACTRAIASANRPATLRTFSSGQPERRRARCRS